VSHWVERVSPNDIATTASWIGELATDHNRQLFLRRGVIPHALDIESRAASRTPDDIDGQQGTFRQPNQLGALAVGTSFFDRVEVDSHR
jgi:hypothetical protein